MRPAVVASVTLALGIGVAFGTSGFARGFVGDVLVVVFLVAVLATAGLGSAKARLVGVGALAIGTELFQGLGLVGPDAPLWLHLTLGSTMDPWDLLAYAAGLAAAWGFERRWAR